MGNWGFFKGKKENWFSNSLYNWMDGKAFPYASQLHERCKPESVRKALEPFLDMLLMGIEYYPEGTFCEKGKPVLANIPAFYLVRIREFISENHVAHIKLFLPLLWNKRFMGIAGAGTNLETDWDKEQTTNLTSWPMAVRNGYACVVNDGATGMFVDASWGFKNGDLDWDFINYWAYTGTHRVTCAARAVVEAVYEEPIYKSYMHGTSGGGRQILMMAQRYPEDYDGLWADGPLYDYYNLMFSCVWAPLVFYNEPHKVPLSKYKKANELARQIASRWKKAYDPEDAIWKEFINGLEGVMTEEGRITEEDLKVMCRVWGGPKTLEGEMITYGFGPEITQWPVGPRQFGYLRIKENGHPSIIPFAYQFIRWLVRDPSWDFTKCSYQEFDQIYKSHKKEFERFTFYDADIREFAGRDGKLMITHGTGDHISPHQLTLDYYKKAQAYFPSEEKMNEAFCTFFPEGGGHALYDWDGPNVTNAAGMTALTRWVEEGKIPETLRTVNYDFMEERVTKESEVRRYSMSEGEGDGLRV